VVFEPFVGASNGIEFECAKNISTDEQNRARHEPVVQLLGTCWESHLSSLTTPDLSISLGTLSKDLCPVKLGAHNRIGVSMTGTVRRWATGVGLAGAAVAAAAMIGAAGAPAACADVIDDLLIQAEGDIDDAATLYSGIDAAELPAKQAANIGAEVSALQNQAGLVSQIQSQQDALTEALQTNSQLVGADNQLATASGDLLSATNAYVNDADAGDYVTGYATTLTSYVDRLDYVYAEVFQFLPAMLNAEFTTLFDGFPNVEPIVPPDALADLAGALDASPAADLASSLDPATVTDPTIFADLLSSIGF